MYSVSRQKKNILFIEANTDGTIGGSHLCLLEIVKNLNKHEFNPLVLFYQHNKIFSEFMEYCPVILLEFKRGFSIKNRFPKIFDYSQKIYLGRILLLIQKGINFVGYFLPRLIEICLILRKFKIDIVHMNNIPVLKEFFLASKCLRIKCVSHIRGNWRPNSIERVMVEYYDAIIAISKSVAEYTRLDNLKNFKTVHDGIDIDKILSEKRRKENEIRNELGIEEDCFFIAVIGNIKDWKGQHVAIEAMNLMRHKERNMKCVIVGDLSNLDQDRRYFGYLQCLVKEYHLEREIIFSGFRKDSLDIINSLDIMLHTSVAPEPLGRVILEGMVFGKPVIATAHGGPLEIIEDGISGFLVHPNDPTALAEKIDYLIENKNLLRKIGEQAQKRVRECFGIEANIKQLELIYKGLVSPVPAHDSVAS